MIHALVTGSCRAYSCLGVRKRNGCGSGLHQSLRTHACCRLGSLSGPSPPQHAWARGGVCTQLKSHRPRGASPQAERGRACPQCCTRAQGAPTPRRLGVRGKHACGCTRTGGSTRLATMSAGKRRAPPCRPGPRDAPPLGSHTHSVHEDAGLGFALTRHASALLS